MADVRDVDGNGASICNVLSYALLATILSLMFATAASCY